MSKNQSIINGILYGTGTMSIVWAGRVLFLDSTTRYTGNMTATAFTIGILLCGIFVCYRKVYRNGKVNYFSPGKIVLAAIFFSFSVGLSAGIIQYLDASVIDSHSAENALEASRARWAANNYTKEAIAGQIELTDTFQRPWKWASVTGFFMFILSLILFVTVGCFSMLTINHNKTSRPAS